MFCYGPEYFHMNQAAHHCYDRNRDLTSTELFGIINRNANDSFLWLVLTGGGASGASQILNAGRKERAVGRHVHRKELQILLFGLDPNLERRRLGMTRQR